MKKGLIFLGTVLALLPAFHVASAACTPVTSTFPTALDNFVANDCIPAAGWNSIESTIGTTTATSSLVARIAAISSSSATSTITASGTTLTSPFLFGTSTTVLPFVSGSQLLFSIVNTGNWAGAWQTYMPSDFLSSSTGHLTSYNVSSANNLLSVSTTTTSATLTVTSTLVNSLSNNSAAGGIDFSAATGTAITGVLHSLAISQFTGNYVATFNGGTGTASYVVSSTNGFISITTSTTSSLLTFSSSSLSLGSIASHPTTDFLASSTGGIYTTTGGVLTSTTSGATTTITLSTTTLNTQVSALGYVTSTAGTLTTSTALASGQVDVSSGTSTIANTSAFTFASSTGLLSAPTGTFTGSLSVGTSTQSGVLNIGTNSTETTAMNIDGDGNVTFGQPTPAIQSSISSTVSFVNLASNTRDMYVTFLNNADGKGEYFDVRASSTFANIRIQTGGVGALTSQWDLGNFGSKDFSIVDDFNSTTPFTMKFDAPSNSLVIASSGAALFGNNIVSQGSAPTATCAAGSSTVATNSTDNGGSITNTSSTTSCTVTFSTVFINAPTCIAQVQSGTIQAYKATSTASAFTFTAAAAMATGSITNYICIGH